MNFFSRKPKSPIRVAIIGTGGMAHTHAKHFKGIEGCEVVAGVEYRYGWLSLQASYGYDEVGVNAYISIPLQQREFIPHIEEPGPYTSITPRPRLEQWNSDAEHRRRMIQALLRQDFKNVRIATESDRLIVVLTTVPLFASILRIPFSIIAPVIIVICAIGAYTVHSAMLDVWFMLGFGVVGYVFKKLDYPLAPLVLALVLGDLAESALRQSLIMSQGSILIFFTRPIAGAISIVAVFFFALPILTPWWRRLRGLPDGTPARQET
jgi:hypothetical protein